jgi:hypothetical protein
MSLKSYCLHQKYSFLREAAGVKKELRKYSKLLESKAEFSEVDELRRKSAKSLALWSLCWNLGTAERAFYNLDYAKGTLRTLREDNKKYRWGIV